MNIEAQQELDRILGLDPNELTEYEVGFLRARRSYLSEEQKAVYADVLSEVAETPVGATSESEHSEPAEKPAKSKK